MDARRRNQWLMAGAGGVVRREGGADIHEPLAVVVTGGIVTSTLLIVLSTIYALFADRCYVDICPVETQALESRRDRSPPSHIISPS